MTLRSIQAAAAGVCISMAKGCGCLNSRRASVTWFCQCRLVFDVRSEMQPGMCLSSCPHMESVQVNSAL